MSLKSSLLLCLFSAILLALSFPVPNIGFFAWFGLVPLLFAIDRKGAKQAFFLAYFTGIIFFFAIIYWLIRISLPGTIVLVLYLGLYFGIFGLLVSRIQCARRSLTHLDFLFIPALWVSLEFLRSYLFTGFGWALLGYSQYRNLPFIQISDITGAYGVSFLVVIINVAVYSVLSSRFSAVSKKKYLIPVVVLTLTLAYGYYKLYQKPQAADPPEARLAKGGRKSVKISLIQGNIPQDIKWDQDSQNFIVDRYEQLTRMAAFNLPQLIIWPETAVPVYPAAGEPLWDKVLNLARDMKTPLLTGLPRYEGDKIFNSIALISEKGAVTAYYDKLRLVPFGEYIPEGFIFSFLKTLDQRTGGAGFSRGDGYTIFEIPLSPGSVKFAVLICFEDIFPHLARENVRRGADFLINSTNDAWFGRTSQPYQHAQASVFRAVENRVSVVRSANTGPSLFIDPQGKIYSPLTDSKGEDLFVTGYQTAKVRLSAKRLSFYTRFGDVFAFLSILTTIIFLLCFRLKLSYRNKRISG